MQRLWLIGAGVLLLLAAVLFLGDPFGARDADDLPDGIVILDGHPEESPDGAPSSTGGPTLERATGGAAGAATPPAGSKGRGADAAQQGRAEILVLSAETDTPLEKATLEAEDGTLLGETDETGLLVIELVPAHGLDFRASRAGYLAQIASVHPGERVEVALRPGIPVSGRIVRAGTRGDPGTAGVSVLDEDRGAEITTLTTAEDGRFLFTVRPNRPFLMVITLDGLAPHVARVVVDAPTEDLQVVVGEGGHLSGRVLDLDGNPRAEVTVRLLHKGEQLFEWRVPPEDETRAEARHVWARTPETTTDKEGRYEFHGVELDREFEPVAVLAPRFEARGKVVKFQDANETIERDITVPDRTSLRLRVEDAHGKALGDVDLHLASARGSWRPLVRDARVDGDLVLEDLTAGEVTITAARAGEPTLEKKVTLVTGKQARVTITFPVGASLRGRVLDKRRKPIAKAHVHWRGSTEGEEVEALTEPDGTFHLRRLTSPKGRVGVSARDLALTPWAYESHIVEEAEAGGPTLEITLKDGTRVHGRFFELPDRAQVTSSMGGRGKERRLQLGEGLTFKRRGPEPKRAALFVFPDARLPSVAALGTASVSKRGSARHRRARVQACESAPGPRDGRGRQAHVGRQGDRHRVLVGREPAHGSGRGL